MIPDTHKTLEIVRTYQDPNAATGEGRVFVTASGEHWRQVLYLPGPRATGERRGLIRGNRVVETSEDYDAR